MPNYLRFTPELETLLSPENLKLNEQMSLHTSFKVGGPADIFITPTSYLQLAQSIKLADSNQIPYLILGKGSNLIVRDGGIRGMVISTEKLNRIIVTDDYLMVDTGTELKDLVNFTAEKGLTGLEFACGIPGSVGGAVYMNAGAYEGEISQTVDFTVNLNLNEDGELRSTFPYEVLPIENAHLGFGYRKSRYQNEKLVMLYAAFKLKSGNPSAIKFKIAEFTQARESKQPLEYPSAGSVFKRPEGHYTGALIQECNLRGHQIGGAAVSDKHCGFIINTGGATAGDIENLILYIQKNVFNTHRVKLETEVKIIGEY